MTTQVILRCEKKSSGESNSTVCIIPTYAVWLLDSHDDCFSFLKSPSRYMYTERKRGCNTVCLVHT